MDSAATSPGSEVLPHPARVSMIVAAHHRPESILVTLHSLLIQSHPLHEIIVVHDGPGPDVRAVVQAVGDVRIRYMEMPERKNDWGNSSKEAGSKIATGDYIGHSNDDNYYAPHYVRELVGAMEREGAGFAYCNMIHSHQAYRLFNTWPAPGGIDGGGWICRADIVKRTPWPPDKADSYADGNYAAALCAHTTAVKVDAVLFVHN